MIDAELPPDSLQHFMIRILVENFWPIPMLNKQDISTFVCRLHESASWSSVEEFQVDGLWLYRFEK